MSGRARSGPRPASYPPAAAASAHRPAPKVHEPAGVSPRQRPGALASRPLGSFDSCFARGLQVILQAGRRAPAPAPALAVAPGPGRGLAATAAAPFAMAFSLARRFASARGPRLRPRRLLSAGLTLRLIRNFCRCDLTW